MFVAHLLLSNSFYSKIYFLITYNYSIVEHFFYLNATFTEY